jgi:hypothetical protein
MSGAVRRYLLRGLLVAVPLAIVVAFSWPDSAMISREIGCARVDDARGRKICDSLSASMQWTWMGHAIVSPGWRVTWAGLKRVYCRDHITTADVPVLRRLSGAGGRRLGDWRLESGAADLLEILKHGDSTVSETSIFNPRNSSYILRDGCAGS